MRPARRYLLLGAGLLAFALRRRDAPAGGAAALPPEAFETRRGREADTPAQIGARGWRDILVRVATQVSRDNIWVIAAGVAFYALLSLFPAIAATISIYGLVADIATIQDHMLALGTILPEEAREIVAGQIRAVTASPAAALGVGAAVTLGFAIWSAASAVKALMAGLTVAYNEDESRGFLAYNVVALTLTLAAILFLLVSLGTIIVLPIAFATVGLGETVETLLTVLRWPILAVMVMLALAALYRYAPSRTAPQWRWVSWGSVAATAAWVLASIGFSWYVANFGAYNETYGTLGAVVILLMWFYLTAFIVLIGAELNAEMEHQTARDTTVAPKRPIGRRGAYVADTVGVSP